MKTEGDWLNAISEAAGASRPSVEEVLLRHGVRAQSTLPRAKKVSFRSISFEGTKVGSKSDGPFKFTWDELGPGLWAVMSDRNFRGKSSIMNMFMAALRGDFPGKIKADVWKWLAHLEVGFQIDTVNYKVVIEKEIGHEEQPLARLLRQDGDNRIELYVGAIGEGLKLQTESLLMDELGFTKIHAAASHGASHAHSWPAVSSALFIGGHSDSKALFGDVLMDGLPLRLLQMFIGLPWVSTLTAASTALKLLEHAEKNRDRGVDHMLAFRNRLRVVQGELDAEGGKSQIQADRTELRREMSRLDTELVKTQAMTAVSRSKVEALLVQQFEVETSRDSLARLIQQLQDEAAAGYAFRQLRPVCCPACEADFKATLASSPNHENCPLCKTELTPSDEMDNERVSIAKQDLHDTMSALKNVRAELKAAENGAREIEEHKRELEAKLASVQSILGTQSDDNGLRIAELTATVRELTNLLGEEIHEPKKLESPDKAILSATVAQTRRMFEELQKAVLHDVSVVIKRLAINFGVDNVADMTLNGAGHLSVVQGGAETTFSKLTDGERLRVKIAAALATVEVARLRGLGRHPGLLLLDSPGSEEVAAGDFHEMLLSVAKVAKEMGGVQIIIGTVYRKELEGVIPHKNRKRTLDDGYLF